MNSSSTNEPLKPATMLAQLKYSLQALAMPGDIQRQLFPDFTCKTDELVLDFDHWADCVKRNSVIELTAEQMTSLADIGEKIASMSDTKEEALWSEDGLSYHPEWSELRQLASRALAIFGWKEEPPPVDRGKYV